MRVGAWLYPWDVWRLGVQETVARAVALGLNELRVAVAYHPVEYDVHGSGVKVRRGGDAVYETSGAPQWGPLIPVMDPGALAASGWLSMLVGEGRSQGLEISAWLVAFRNRTLGGQYEKWAIRNAWGEWIPDGLCPSHLEVQNYAKGLIRLASAAGVASVTLESAGFAPYVGVATGGSPLHQILTRLCLCSGCAARFGHLVDLDAVGAAIRKAAEMPTTSLYDPWGWAFLQSHLALGRYLAARRTFVKNLWWDLREDAHRAGIRFCIVGRWPDTWCEGYSSEGFNQLDEFTHLFYNEVDRDLQAWQWLQRHTTASLTCGVKIGSSPDHVQEQLGVLTSNGIDRVVWYNLSRVSEGAWSWIARTTSG